MEKQVWGNERDAIVQDQLDEGIRYRLKEQEIEMVQPDGSGGKKAGKVQSIKGHGWFQPKGRNRASDRAWKHTYTGRASESKAAVLRRIKIGHD